MLAARMVGYNCTCYLSSMNYPYQVMIKPSRTSFRPEDSITLNLRRFCLILVEGTEQEIAGVTRLFHRGMLHAELPFGEFYSMAGSVQKSPASDTVDPAVVFRKGRTTTQPRNPSRRVSCMLSTARGGKSNTTIIRVILT